MEKEMEALQRDLRHVEDSHGNQVLNLVLARGYLGKLLGNTRIARYLGQRHGDIFRELQTISEGSSLENLTLLVHPLKVQSAPFGCSLCPDHPALRLSSP